MRYGTIAIGRFSIIPIPIPIVRLVKQHQVKGRVEF